MKDKIARKSVEDLRYCVNDNMSRLAKQVKNDMLNEVFFKNEHVVLGEYMRSGHIKDYINEINQKLDMLFKYLGVEIMTQPNKCLVKIKKENKNGRS